MGSCQHAFDRHPSRKRFATLPAKHMDMSWITSLLLGSRTTWDHSGYILVAQRETGNVKEHKAGRPAFIHVSHRQHLRQASTPCGPHRIDLRISAEQCSYRPITWTYVFRFFQDLLICCFLNQFVRVWACQWEADINHLSMFLKWRSYIKSSRNTHRAAARKFWEQQAQSHKEPNFGEGGGIVECEKRSQILRKTAFVCIPYRRYNVEPADCMKIAPV